MYSYLQHYIDGQWVDSDGGTRHQVISPATEEPVSEITLGTAADVDKAVAAAQRAFATFSVTDKEERLQLLQRVVEEYKARMPVMAKAISEEMGAPISMASTAQVGAGLGHLLAGIEALRNFEFEEKVGKNLVLREAIGVVALITPWNWPLNQIAAKVAPALAAGNAVILKPSEQTPSSAAIFAEALHAAGVPAGVFNLVQGDGPGVGTFLSKHPGVAMVSFTGSTRAGIMVAKNAADTVKRVHQELGGKSANIILPGADLNRVLKGAALRLLMNSGQSCIAPMRLLVHRSQYDEAVAHLRAFFEQAQVDEPLKEGSHIGPVVNRPQYEKIQSLIQAGIDEGAELLVGGPGRFADRDRGYYVKPTLFAGVTNDMIIAREEIFGPVLGVMVYDEVEEAIGIANDTVYGLAAYVMGDPAQALEVVRKLRSGSVFVNAANLDPNVPFGGYKQSGNGREFGKYGLEEFTELKGVIGDLPDGAVPDIPAEAAA
ncbi:MAG TPA: aldehyde dehydrogenase family protein [Allosphingosinicella sp.]